MTLKVRIWHFWSADLQVLVRYMKLTEGSFLSVANAGLRTGCGSWNSNLKSHLQYWVNYTKYFLVLWMTWIIKKKIIVPQEVKNYSFYRIEFEIWIRNMNSWLAAIVENVKEISNLFIWSGSLLCSFISLSFVNIDF